MFWLHSKYFLNFHVEVYFIYIVSECILRRLLSNMVNAQIYRREQTKKSVGNVVTQGE